MQLQWNAGSSGRVADFHSELLISTSTCAPTATIKAFIAFFSNSTKIPTQKLSSGHYHLNKRPLKFFTHSSQGRKNPRKTCKQLWYGLKRERKRYFGLKEEALDRTVRRTRFGEAKDRSQDGSRNEFGNIIWRFIYSPSDRLRHYYTLTRNKRKG
jgi:hypothetical protein